MANPGITFSGEQVLIRTQRGTTYVFHTSETVRPSDSLNRIREAAEAAGATTYGDLANSTKRAAFLAALDPNG